MIGLRLVASPIRTDCTSAPVRKVRMATMIAVVGIILWSANLLLIPAHGDDLS